jgi:hypothetical protein
MADVEQPVSEDKALMHSPDIIDSKAISLKEIKPIF